jgi:hypothetical protein
MVDEKDPAKSMVLQDPEGELAVQGRICRKNC